MAQDILFPVGRFVGGGLYKPQPAQPPAPGQQPKIDPTTGKPPVKYSFAVAYQKQPGQTHWSQTDWGAKIWAEGHAGFPNGEAQHPSFAWKITDGDSTVPNRRGNKPCDNEGWPGHWVVWYSGSYAPKTCIADGKVTYSDQEERIKVGHYVQVFGSVADNKPSQSPGVYMNYKMVAHAAFGPEIATGAAVDAASVGFGGGALPAGASAVPLAQMTAAQAAGAPAAPPVAHTAPAALPVAAPTSSVASTITPNPAFLQPPAAPVPPLAAPPAAPAAPVKQLTPKAGATTYEQFVQAGWSDEQMRAEGYLV